MVFDSCRYDIRFRRYDRSKRIIIFNGTRAISLARWPTPSAAHVHWSMTGAESRFFYYYYYAYALPGKESRSRRFQEFEPHWCAAYFSRAFGASLKSLYLGNPLRYRAETNCILQGMSPSIVLDALRCKIFTFLVLNFGINFETTDFNIFETISAIETKPISFFKASSILYNPNFPTRNSKIFSHEFLNKFWRYWFERYWSGVIPSSVFLESFELSKRDKFYSV